MKFLPCFVVFFSDAKTLFKDIIIKQFTNNQNTYSSYLIILLITYCFNKTLKSNAFV